MNHITRTQIERDSAIVFRETLLSNLVGLKSYLCSDKFRCDTTVQVTDVLFRLEESISDAHEKADDYQYDETQKIENKERLIKSRGKADCEQCGYYGLAWGDFQIRSIHGLSDPAGYPVRLCGRCYNAAKKRGDIIE